MIILALTPALMVGKITDTVGGSGGPATPFLWRKWGATLQRAVASRPDGFGGFWSITKRL